MMLAKLGLRADEVATLTLDDIDWRAGEMIIRAKGRQRARMPIPRDVGAAVGVNVPIVEGLAADFCLRAAAEQHSVRQNDRHHTVILEIVKSVQQGRCAPFSVISIIGD
jgi:site-specific recombinase XerC